MILVVGGQGSGKREFVRGLGYADVDMAESLSGREPVLVDLHRVLRDDNLVPDAVATEVAGKKVIVCNEVGCGVVPMDASERAWRDRVGRTCARIAGQADTVVRMCCGIPHYLKGGPK